MSLRNRVARRGSTYVIVVMMLPVLLAFVAMGLDWGRVGVARYQVQAAADAGAVAAASMMEDPEAAYARAEAFVSAVKVNGYTAQITDFEIGYWDGTAFDTASDEDANAVRVEAAVTVGMPFSALFGINDVEARAEAGAAPHVVNGRAPDLVIVLDVTGSMSTSEIAAERDAAEALVDCIDRRSAPTSRASLVTFTGRDFVQIGMSDFGTHADDLMAAAGSVQGCGSWGAPPCSGTNQASGYYAALDILAGADTPEGVGQAILLMSDGLPNADDDLCTEEYLEDEFLFDLEPRCEEIGETCSTSWQYRWGRWRQVTTCGTEVTDQHIIDWTSEQQFEAEAAGVDVYTVYYGTDWSGQEFLSDHVRANDGTAEVALTKAQIEEKFIDVCLEYTIGTSGLLW